MQVTVTTQTEITYTFDELDDHAKETAREWYRAGNLDYDWFDFVFEDAKIIAKLMGVDIEKIYFSGFSSQGDGACFIGSYYYKKGSAKAVRAYAPTDKTLHQIAADLTEIQRRNFYQLYASVTHRGHYNHEYCTDIGVYRDGYDTDSDTADEIAELMRDFMRWIYKQLESEYEYLNSDEAVDESILCNGYDFDEDGNPAI